MSVKDQSEVTTGGSSTSRVHFTLSIMRTAPHPSLPSDGEKVIMQGDATAVTAGEKASVNNDSTAATTEDKLAARNDAVIPSNQDGSRLSDASPLDAAPATKAATSESGTMQDSRGRVITDRRRKLSEGNVVLLAAVEGYSFILVDAMPLQNRGLRQLPLIALTWPKRQRPG